MTSFPRRCGRGTSLIPGSRSPRAYTRGMRRWVCIIGLLAGFASADPGRGARIRQPVAVERSLASFRADDPAALPTTAAWWIRP